MKYFICNKFASGFSDIFPIVGKNPLPCFLFFFLHQLYNQVFFLYYPNVFTSIVIYPKDISHITLMFYKTLLVVVSSALLGFFFWMEVNFSLNTVSNFGVVPYGCMFLGKVLVISLSGKKSVF